MRSKQPLILWFTAVWIVLALLLPFLWLANWVLMSIWLTVVVWMSVSYLRHFEQSLIYGAQEGQSPSWFVKDVRQQFWPVSPTYIGPNLVIFSYEGGWRQSILLAPMFSSEHWRQLQLRLRWSDI